jgi:hypothetical protein
MHRRRMQLPPTHLPIPPRGVMSHRDQHETQISSEIRTWLKEAFQMRRNLITSGLDRQQIRIDLVLRVFPRRARQNQKDHPPTSKRPPQSVASNQLE